MTWRHPTSREGATAQTQAECDCETPIICAHFGCAYRDERKEAMTCPPCNRNCNQGRDCPARRDVPVWRPPAWVWAGAAAMWALIIWWAA